MTKVFMVLFGALTILAVYATAIDWKVKEDRVSVRENSVGHSRHHGGYRRGK